MMRPRCEITQLDFPNMGHNAGRLAARVQGDEAVKWSSSVE